MTTTVCFFPDPTHYKVTLPDGATIRDCIKEAKRVKRIVDRERKRYEKVMARYTKPILGSVHYHLGEHIFHSGKK